LNTNIPNQSINQSICYDDATGSAEGRGEERRAGKKEKRKEITY
jgi:hypothetical protein